jgi:hypothetical protein
LVHWPGPVRQTTTATRRTTDRRRGTCSAAAVPDVSSVRAHAALPVGLLADVAFGSLCRANSGAGWPRVPARWTAMPDGRRGTRRRLVYEAIEPPIVECRPGLRPGTATQDRGGRAKDELKSLHSGSIEQCAIAVGSCHGGRKELRPSARLPSETRHRRKASAARFKTDRCGLPARRRKRANSPPAAHRSACHPPD